MALYINSTKIGSAAYNVHNSVSTKLNKMKMSNTEVWTGLPAIYNTVKNSTSAITQSQWLEFLNAGCVALVISNNDNASFLNKKITLNNSIVTSYKTWKIADFNHDNSGNTVDLIQANSIHKSVFGSSHACYPQSTIKNWLINTYMPGFDADIKNKLQLMPTITYDYDYGLITASYKIKIPSAVEISDGYGSNVYDQGTKYPIFTSRDDRIRDGADPNNNWWTRSTVKNSITKAYYVNSMADIYQALYTNSFGIVPILRF